MEENAVLIRHEVAFVQFRRADEFDGTSRIFRNSKIFFVSSKTCIVQSVLFILSYSFVYLLIYCFYFICKIVKVLSSRCKNCLYVRSY